MDKARENERDHIIQEEDWADVKEEQMCKTVGLRQQVAWTKRKLQWKITWGTSCKRMSIVSDSSSMPYQAQPISIMWGNHETPICQLCSKRGYLEHLQSRCPKALQKVATTGVTPKCWKQWQKALAMQSSLGNNILPRRGELPLSKLERSPANSKGQGQVFSTQPGSYNPIWGSNWSSPSTLLKHPYPWSMDGCCWDASWGLINFSWD